MAKKQPKKKMGRPCKSFEKRSEIVILRVTPGEKAMLNEESKKSGETVSEILMRPWRKEGR